MRTTVHNLNRQGFTLLEMLIAAGIFLFGFMAVYSLVLIGAESRQKAESITRTAVAADALLEDWRLRFSVSDYRSKEPIGFVGDGNPLDGAEGGSFHTSPEHPGVLFQVIDCSSLSGDENDASTSALYLELLVLYQAGIARNAEPDGSVPYSALLKRLPKLYRYFKSPEVWAEEDRDPINWQFDETRLEQVQKKLVDDGLAQRYQTVINRTRLAGN